MKSSALLMLLALSHVCLADIAELSRSTKFASPEQFVEAARHFHPGSKPSEFGYIFSAPELGHDDTTYGQLVFADTIAEVAEIWRGSDLCAYFLQASPKTDYTRSYVAALLLLQRSIETGLWHITTVERFQAIGVGGGIDCKVIRKPKQSTASRPLTVRVTEVDAGRHDVSEERVYTLAVGHSVRLRPVNTK